MVQTMNLVICFFSLPGSGILWKRLNILSQFRHHTVAQSFQLYGHQTIVRNFDGVTSWGGAKYKLGIIFLRFSTNNSLYISQTIQDRSIVTMVR